MSETHMQKAAERSVEKENSKYDQVILADGHQNMLEGIRSLLETTFDTVLMVADNKSLLNTAARLKTDLVVADLSLPALPASNGVNMVRIFKDLFPDMKLIVLSIHDEPAAIKEVMAAGAEGFVLKRSVATDLIPAVHAVIENQIYISPLARKDLEPERQRIK
jgi:DNA-binding NarL/FixJ family response regulator